MRITGPIFALDLGTRCGFAVGAPGAKLPRSGTHELKQRGQPIDAAFGELLSWLNDEWMRQTPALVVMEAPLSLQGFKTLGNSQEAVQTAYGFHGILRALCRRSRIPIESKHDASIRKHFIGKGRMGTRAATKAAVIQRCHVLGLMPKDCMDDNRADAIATWSWAQATYGGRAADVLHLFGEQVA